MKKLLSVFAVLLATAGLQAQVQYNDANAEVRSVGSFSGIKVSNGIEMVLSQGSEAVAVSAENAEDRSRIKTVVEGGVLKIYYEGNALERKRGWNMSGRKLKAYVAARTLTSLRASSGAGVKIQGVFTADNIDMDFSSGASVSGELNAKEVRADQSSGAVSTISGRADKLFVKAGSGGIFKGFGFSAGSCQAETKSGGVVEISVNTALEARASSGGLVRYKGSCTVSKSTSSGGAVVNKS